MGLDLYSPVHTIRFDYNADIILTFKHNKRGGVRFMLTFTYSKRGRIDYNADMYSYLYTQ